MMLYRTHDYINDRIKSNKTNKSERVTKFHKTNISYFKSLGAINKSLKVSSYSTVFYRSYLNLNPHKVFSLTKDFIKYMNDVYLYYQSTTNLYAFKYKYLPIASQSPQVFHETGNTEVKIYSYYEDYNNMRSMLLRKIKQSVSQIIENLYTKSNISIHTINTNISDTRYLICLFRGILFTINTRNINIGGCELEIKQRDTNIDQETESNSQYSAMDTPTDIQLFKIVIRNLFKFINIFTKQKRFIMQLYIDNIVLKVNPKQLSQYSINNILSFIDFNKF
tara:strand:+ start:3797 stop:4633 length:837 start_codon:yes stop_codon:yes gene_type:complete